MRAHVRLYEQLGNGQQSSMIGMGRTVVGESWHLEECRRRCGQYGKEAVRALAWDKRWRMHPS